MAYRTDFLNLYTGAELAKTGSWSQLYNFNLQVQVEDRLVPGPKRNFPFVRPPFYAFLLSPIALLPVHIAFPVWIVLQTAGMFAIWYWAWRRFGPDSLVYCSFFVPMVLGIMHGQDCVVLVAVMLGAWLLLERERDRWAGVLLALSLFKFHLFVLVPLSIILRKRWKLFQGYSGGAVALLAGSLALCGLRGARGYVDLLTRKDLETLSPSPENMVGVSSIAVNLGFEGLLLPAVLAVMVVALVIWTTLHSRSDFAWFWSAVAGSFLLSPHTYAYDLSSLLIPGLIAVFTLQDRITRIAAAVSLIALPYFFTMAPKPWPIVPSLVTLTFLVALSGFVQRLRPARGSRDLRVTA